MRFALIVLRLALCLCVVPVSVAQHPEVQVIYFQPSNVQPPTKKDFQRITETLEAVQSFFREQMIRYGHGPKTFAFECKIHLVKGTRPVKEYSNVPSSVGMDRIEADFPRRLFMEFGEKENMQVVFLAGAKFFDIKAVGTAMHGCQNKGCLYWSIITTENPNVMSVIAAHELAHNLGLDHREQPNLLMNPQLADDGLPRTLKRYLITAEEAEILSKHPFFHDIPIVEPPPKNPILSVSITSKVLYL